MLITIWISLLIGSMVVMIITKLLLLLLLMIMIIMIIQLLLLLLMMMVIITVIVGQGLLDPELVPPPLPRLAGPGGSQRTMAL